MVQPKYNSQQAMNRIRLMMNYDISKTLSENKEILSIIDKSNDTDFIFDFVISETNGILIYMDNVFSKKHGFIGNLWENTWVFNEIIKENINKYSSLIGESVERDLDSILMSITWTKEFVAECILGIGVLSEGFSINEQFLDKLKAGAQKVAQGINRTGSAIAKGTRQVLNKAAEYGKKLLSGPILGTLRWIRRNAYTSIGLVVDVVTAMLPATTMINKIAWVMIVILDFYELLTRDIDTKDEPRMANPYMYLIIDIISMLFSVAAGKAAQTSIKATVSGSAKLPSTTVRVLKSLLNKLPGLKNTLSSIGGWLSKNLPKINGIINFVLRGFDSVIKGVENFIKQLLSKQGAVALATGGMITWFFKPRLLQLNDTGKDIEAVNMYIGEYHNIAYQDMPNCQLSPDIIDRVKNSGDRFTKDTETAIKKIESCLSKKYPSIIKNIDGKISNEELALYTNVQMDDRGIITRFIPHTTKEAVSSVISQVMKGASKFAQDKLEVGTKNNV